MDSGFETHNLVKSLSNYPFVKGDVSGHAFHGNQYITAFFHSVNPIVRNEKSIGGASSELREFTAWMEGGVGSGGGRTNAHIYIANAHREIGKALEKIGTPEALTAATAHVKAAQAHDHAEQALDTLYNGDEKVGYSSDGERKYDERKEYAQDATNRADAITQDLIKNNPPASSL